MSWTDATVNLKSMNLARHVYIKAREEKDHAECCLMSVIDLNS